MLQQAVDPSGKLVKEKTEWMALAYWNAGLPASQQFPNTKKYEGGQRPYEFVERVYNYYAWFYHRRPARYLWMGAANRAGVLVKSSLDASQSVINELWDEIEWDYDDNGKRYAVSLDVDDSSKIRTAMAMEHARDRTYEMIHAVFRDMSWQHEAYHQEGLQEIKDHFDQGNLSRRSYDAWCKIDNGDFTGGNMLLLEEEQRVILQPFWDEFNIAESIFAEYVAESFVYGAKSFWDWRKPMGTHGYGMRISDEDARWAWISHELMPAWNSLSVEDRSKLVPDAERPADWSITYDD